MDNLKFLPTLFTAMQISLVKGFLFRTTTKHASVSSSPLLVSAAQARLVSYLKSLDLYTKEPIHGFRGYRCPPQPTWRLKQQHRSAHRVVLPTMVGRFTQIGKVLAAADTSEKLSFSTLP